MNRKNLSPLAKGRFIAFKDASLINEQGLIFFKGIYITQIATIFAIGSYYGAGFKMFISKYIFTLLQLYILSSAESSPLQNE